MLKVRAIADIPAVAFLAVMAGVGIAFFFIAQELGALEGLVIFLIVPVIVFVLPLALGQALRSLGVLLKSLTWWHGLWLILYLSELVFRVRGGQGLREQPIDLWAAYRIALVGIVAFVLGIRLTLRQTPWLSSLFRGVVGALATYALISATSTLWSVFPGWTLYKSLEYLVGVALVAAVLATVRSVETYKTLFDWTWLIYGLLLVSVWSGAVLWPQEAFLPSAPGSLLGVSLHGVVPAEADNNVGEYGAILAIVALSRLLASTDSKPNRVWYRLLFTGALITLVFAQTRSAVTGFLFGAALVLFFSKRKIVTASVLLTTLFLSFTSLANLFWRYFLRGQSGEEFQSLSGRVGWWEFGWETFLHKPLSGFGAYTARFVVLEKVASQFNSHMHNLYLEVLVGTSIWGLIPLLIALFGAWQILVRFLRNSASSSSQRQLAVEGLGVLGLLTVRSFFGSDLAWPYLPFLTILGYAEFLRRRSTVAIEAPVVSPRA